jgi:signal peptidase I
MSGPAPSLSRRIAKILFEVVLTIASVVALVLIGLAIVGPKVGLRPLVVLSGSMEPAIPRGSLVVTLSRDASEVSQGDVVAVDRPDHTVVAHRVIGIERQGDVAELTLKGDANESADVTPARLRQVDVVVWHMPGVGRWMTTLASVQGGFALGCLATVLIIHMLPRRRRRAAAVDECTTCGRPPVPAGQIRRSVTWRQPASNVRSRPSRRRQPSTRALQS